MVTAAQWAVASILTGAALAATSGGWWALAVVLRSGTLPRSPAGYAQAAAATAAGAILGAGLAFGLTLFVQHALELAA